jgi:predicted amidophosphoribosyltransferase
MPTTDTRQRILKFINTQAPVRVKDIIEHFGMSAVIIHKHLKKLLTEERIVKLGSPPRVFYKAAEKTAEAAKNMGESELLENNWLTILPNGSRINGTTGFLHWCEVRGFDPIDKLFEYAQTHEKYDAYRKDGLIYATQKFTETFGKSYLKKAVYLDFFSYEIFGRTKWGQLVLHAKLTEDQNLMNEVFDWAVPQIRGFIALNKIDAVGFIPHSLKRQRPFLPALQKQLKSPAPIISLEKITGEISVAQKTLKKPHDRIENAQSTIFVTEPNLKNYKRILLIDDAVGSGATLQITAEKCKKHGANAVYGLALVGSIKGFEVIAEV